MAFLAIAMAIIEGFTWTIIVQDILPFESTAGRWISGVAVGLVVAGMIWFIDSTFITSDFSKPSYLAQEDREGKPEHLDSIFARIYSLASGESLKLFLAVSLRIGVLLGFTFITAPYLAQILITEDIDAALAEKRGEQRRVLVDTLRSRNADRKAKLTSSLDALRDSLTAEINGTGGSRSYGRSVVAISMEQNIKAKEIELSAIDSLFNSESARIKGMPYDSLVTTYGVPSLVGSFANRQIQIELMGSNNAYQKAERLAILLLYGMFLSTILIKLLQPHAIRLYLNGYLQSRWERYIQGAYDEYIEYEENRSYSRSPLRDYDFEEWLNEFDLKKAQARRDKSLLDEAERSRRARQRARDEKRENDAAEKEKREKLDKQRAEIRLRVEEDEAHADSKTDALLNKIQAAIGDTRTRIAQEDDAYDSALLQLDAIISESEAFSRSIDQIDAMTKSLRSELEEVEGIITLSPGENISIHLIKKHQSLLDEIASLEATKLEKLESSGSYDGKIKSYNERLRAIEVRRTRVRQRLGKLEDDYDRVLDRLLSGMETNIEDLLKEMNYSEEDLDNPML
ncbi:MAG: hypothetical protein AAGI08_00030 [Bacteroidota bacterium]